MILFKRKLIKKLKDAYGKEPVTTYFDGDMNWIRTTCDDRREEEPERFYVDDTTWNDLNMDAVFHRGGTAPVHYAPASHEPGGV